MCHIKFILYIKFEIAFYLPDNTFSNAKSTFVASSADASKNDILFFSKAFLNYLKIF